MNQLETNYFPMEVLFRLKFSSLLKFIPTILLLVPQKTTHLVSIKLVLNGHLAILRVSRMSQALSSADEVSSCPRSSPEAISNGNL